MGAEFVVENLRYRPTKPTNLDVITLYADIVNVGDTDGTATVNLRVNGSATPQQTKSVYIPAGSSVTVSFEIGPLTAKYHFACVSADSSERCIGIPVAESSLLEFISVENLRYSPENPTTEDKVIVSADVVNSGTTNVGVLIGIVVDGREVMSDYEDISAGSRKTASFELSNLSAGTHTICIRARLGEQVADEDCLTITVGYKPAPKFSIENIRYSPLNPTTIDVITITADIVNSGDVGGTEYVVLYVNGQVVNSKYVYVPAKSRETVSFSIGPFSKGVYEVCLS